jgi:NAD(P)-dependent dehydrogenase (short-subunit alcohol dehydrogenase family)
MGLGAGRSCPLPALVATVALAGREGWLQTLQDEVVAAGGPRLLATALDVTDPQTPQSVVEQTLARVGRLDRI